MNACSINRLRHHKYIYTIMPSFPPLSECWNASDRIDRRICKLSPPPPFILSSLVQWGSPFPWPRTTSVESRTLQVWQLLDPLQIWAVTLWPLIMNPAVKRGSESNYTTVRSYICPCMDHMSLTASTHIQISPSVKAAPDNTDLFKYMNMFQMNLCPVLYTYFSIFTSVFVCCSLVPSTSTEKVRHPVLFLDRFKGGDQNLSHCLCMMKNGRALQHFI